MDGLLGGGGEGAKGMLAPLSNYWGGLAPLFLRISARWKSTIKATNDYAKMRIVDFPRGKLAI